MCGELDVDFRTYYYSNCDRTEKVPPRSKFGLEHFLGNIDFIKLLTGPRRLETTVTMSQPAVLAYFFLYSMAMFTFPFITFFGTNYVLREFFYVEGFANTVWSVIASVLSVNIIIGLYAFRAYHEHEPEMDQPPPVPPRMKRSDLNLKQE